MEELDFSTPLWLTTYYHVIGTVSLIFDAFAIYLVLFKSSKIDNFRYFLLNFQIACSLTDIHITYLMQPIPLYPMMAGFSVGLLPMQFGATPALCCMVVIFFLIYQIESMVFCFVRKHQGIANALGTRYRMPKPVELAFLVFFADSIASVLGLFAKTFVPSDSQLEYVRLNYPQHVHGVESLPNFSICHLDAFFFATVIYSVSIGILLFFAMLLVIFNIFRMLAMLKLKISSQNYQKHRMAVWSLLAQFATSSVCFVPPIFFVFVVLVLREHAQVIVEVILGIVCLHSIFNVTVLIVTFPPYRKFVIELIFQKRIINFPRFSQILPKPSPVVSHLGT